jgi:hypothetical protein
MAKRRVRRNDLTTFAHGNIEPLRSHFHPFGLSTEDERLWNDLKSRLVIVARTYIARDQHEYIEKIRIGFNQLEIYLKQAARSLSALPKLARGYVVGFQPLFADDYPTQGPSGRGAADQGPETWSAIEALFEPALRDFHARHEAWEEKDTAAFNSARMEAAEYAYNQSLTCTHSASGGRRETCPDCWKVDRELKLAFSQYARGSGEPEPQPYDIIDDEAARLLKFSHYIHETAAKFSKDWPKNSKGGRGGVINAGNAKAYLVEELLDLISLFFSEYGLRRILMSPQAFWALLRDFHFYAKNEELDDQKMKKRSPVVLYKLVVARLRDLGVAEADIPPPLKGRPPRRVDDRR